LQKVKDTMDSIYNIYKDMIDNFLESERIYETYSTLRSIENIDENKILKEIKSINEVQDNDMTNQFNRIIDIYKKIEKNEKKIKKKKKEEKKDKEDKNEKKEYKDKNGKISEYKINNIIKFLLNALTLIFAVLLFFIYKSNQLENKYDKYKIIIGIDLGNTSTVYIIINSDDDLNNLEWEFRKIPSEIILDSDTYNLIEIGEYNRCIQKNNLKSQKRVYFSFFKKKLEQKENNNNNIFNIEVEATSPKDTKVYLSKVYEGYLTLMRKQIINNLFRYKINNINKIKWVLTIPPLWHEEEKEFMKNIAQLSGMNDIDIALEPEAYSLAIFNSSDIEGNKINLKKGDTFLLVDLGGYSVDFSGFKILDDNNNLEQLIASESMELGSNIINEKIIDIIKFVYGERAIETLKKNDDNEWERILYEIEEKKNSRL